MLPAHNHVCPIRIMIVRQKGSAIEFELDPDLLPSIFSYLSSCDAVRETCLDRFYLEIKCIMKHSKEIDDPMLIYGGTGKGFEINFGSEYSSLF
jgi:hypothetical protein